MAKTLFQITSFIGITSLLTVTMAVKCGNHFTSKKGSIQSPGHPNQYPPDQYCVWTISVQGSAPQIQLKFSAFDLPNPVDSHCTDYVAVYQGLLRQVENQIAKYCGSALPSDLLVKKTSVRIEFVSNKDDERGKGFMASFYANSNSAITTSQATAGIVAAIFCGIVFLGVGTMRCIMLGACNRCQQPHQSNRECVGSNETMGGEFHMDSPPDYVTVMAHPDRYPASTASQNATPISTPGTSRVLVVRDAGASVSLHSDNDDGGDDDDNDEELPPYPGIVGAETIDPSDYTVRTGTERPQPGPTELYVPVQINETRFRSLDTEIEDGQVVEEGNDLQTNQQSDASPGQTDTNPVGGIHGVSLTNGQLRDNETPTNLNSINVNVSAESLDFPAECGLPSSSEDQDCHGPGISVLNRNGPLETESERSPFVNPLSNSGEATPTSRNAGMKRHSTGPCPGVQYGTHSGTTLSSFMSEPNVVTARNHTAGVDEWL